MSLDKKFLEAQMLYEKRIADLEAKLAESEETIKYLKGIKRYDIGEMLTENTQIKQQLAEKDKQIENLRIDLKDYQDLEEKISTKYDKVVEQLAEKDAEIKRRVAVYEQLFIEQINENAELQQQLAKKDEKLKSLTLARFGSETNKPILTTTGLIRQDKIELLEKVKAELVNNVSPVKLSYTDYVQEVFRKINTLISNIKGE